MRHRVAPASLRDLCCPKKNEVQARGTAQEPVARSIAFKTIRHSECSVYKVTRHRSALGAGLAMRLLRSQQTNLFVSYLEQLLEPQAPSGTFYILPEMLQVLNINRIKHVYHSDI